MYIYVEKKSDSFVLSIKNCMKNEWVTSVNYAYSKQATRMQRILYMRAGRLTERRTALLQPEKSADIRETKKRSRRAREMPEVPEKKVVTYVLRNVVVKKKKDRSYRLAGGSRECHMWFFNFRRKSFFCFSLKRMVGGEGKEEGDTYCGAAF